MVKRRNDGGSSVATTTTTDTGTPPQTMYGDVSSLSEPIISIVKLLKKIKEAPSIPPEAKTNAEVKLTVKMQAGSVVVVVVVAPAIYTI